MDAELKTMQGIMELLSQAHVVIGDGVTVVETTEDKKMAKEIQGFMEAENEL